MYITPIVLSSSILKLDKLFFILRKGNDAGDHPPITPMQPASEAEVGHEAWRLYDYITRHFIATVRKIANLYSCNLMKYFILCDVLTNPSASLQMFIMEYSTFFME